MAEDIEIQKLKKDYPDFFRKTPSEVIDFILSEKTSEKIADIAVKNGIDNEEQIEGIAFRVAWVLLDRLPKENLALTFESGLKIPAETSKKIADEINQFIANAGIKPQPETIPQAKQEIKTEKPAAEEPSERPSSKDAYREKIE